MVQPRQRKAKVEKLTKSVSSSQKSHMSFAQVVQTNEGRKDRQRIGRLYSKNHLHKKERTITETEKGLKCCQESNS